MKTLQSFVTLVAQDRIADARNLLTQELSERVLGALSTAKQELAGNLFGGSPELQEEKEEAEEQEQEQLGEMFTRKHFVAVAKKIAEHPDQKTRNTLAKHHAEIFSASNSRFDHHRFYKASGAEHENYEESVDLEKKKLISELSKGTLKSYIKKATSSHGFHERNAVSNRQHVRNVKNVHSKQHFDAQAVDSERKAEKREKGINKAVDKLEESEQLNELSKGTLKSYIKKSSVDAAHSAGMAQAIYSQRKVKDSKLHRERQTEYENQEQKRLGGIRTAVKKLEESEQIDELALSTRRSYIKKASKTVGNIIDPKKFSKRLKGIARATGK